MHQKQKSSYSAPPNPLAGLGYDVRQCEYFENSAPMIDNKLAVAK